MSKSKKKIFIALLFFMLISFNMSFAFWASNVLGNGSVAAGEISLGKWLPPGFIAVSSNGIGESITLDEIGTSPYPTSGWYMMIEDIDYNNQTFNPIDNFEGLFYGNGYAISNINFSTSSTQIGLFQTITSSGLVHGLKLINASINHSGNADKKAGLIAGINQGTIANSSATGTVSLNLSRGATAGTNNLTAIAGGLVGQNQGLVIDSYANVSVTATTSLTGGFFATKNATSYGGGLVGQTSVIEGIVRTYANGQVTSNATSTGGFIVSNNPIAFGGGLVGQSGGVNQIVDSFSTGNVNSNPTANSGAVVGSGGSTNSYRLNTQTVNGVSGTGLSATINELRSSSFLSTNLEFSTSRWSFTTTAYPTLEIELYELYDG